MRVSFAKAADIPADFWKWPHIDPAKEWADKLTGRLTVETGFLDKLEQLRAAVDRPLIITSGYRTPEHNRLEPDHTSDGSHTLALAADIKVYGAHALELVAAALELGFTGIGISQNGDQAARFIHVDTAPDRDQAPRPWIWSY